MCSLTDKLCTPENLWYEIENAYTSLGQRMIGKPKMLQVLGIIRIFKWLQGSLISAYCLTNRLVRKRFPQGTFYSPWNIVFAKRNLLTSHAINKTS